MPLVMILILFDKNYWMVLLILFNATQEYSLVVCEKLLEIRSCY